jgi:Berberine and berberine like
LRLPPPAQTHFAALGRAVVCQRRVGRGRLKAQYDPENLFRMNYSVSGPQDRLLFMR